MPVQFYIGVFTVFLGFIIVVTAPTNNFYRVYWNNGEYKGINTIATNYGKYPSIEQVNGFQDSQDIIIKPIDIYFVEKITLSEFNSIVHNE